MRNHPTPGASVHVDGKSKNNNTGRHPWTPLHGSLAAKRCRELRAVNAEMVGTGRLFSTRYVQHYSSGQNYEVLLVLFPTAKVSSVAVDWV